MQSLNRRTFLGRAAARWTTSTVARGAGAADDPPVPPDLPYEGMAIERSVEAGARSGRRASISAKSWVTTVIEARCG